MRAISFTEFGGPLDVIEVDDPVAAPHGVVIQVAATGLCRSDWHGWLGHDPDIRLPHVPGHELAGTVSAVGAAVRRWRVGDRVTVPFVCACGRCPECERGAGQVCRFQTQPGFTGWGSFAEFVAIANADVNLVEVPRTVGFDAAASLGCRFATAFRAVADLGRVEAGEWVAVHGCGGVGLSAVMIAAALGARVVAVDVSDPALELARGFGAAECVDASAGDAAERVVEVTGGGAEVSLDALGHPQTCAASIRSLRRQGTHVQVGLLPSVDGDPPVPMERVIGWELRVLGSHGMAASDYPPMMDMVADGRLRPQELIGRRIGLDEVPEALPDLGSGTGITIIRPGA